MQLKSSVRSRLRAATCSLLAVTAGSVSAANFGTKWTVEGASLVYAEAKRTTVFEPLLVIKRDFGDGQTLQGKFVFDAMTGASPTGAAATNKVQTFTTPSGQRHQTATGKCRRVLFKTSVVRWISVGRSRSVVVFVLNWAVICLPKRITNRRV
ncbi:MAG: DUF3570 domain-containing protein [bacterium]|nr:DUF3570 domain-containing protein [bacterium]